MEMLREQAASTQKRLCGKDEEIEYLQRRLAASVEARSLPSKLPFIILWLKRLRCMPVRPIVRECASARACEGARRELSRKPT